ncbi:hypothetical protein SDC9_114836 [bioreactor metagenome]|uniref:Uncharacterized protein n=1 Tax=bioreactor metagenome TaxID=1076179 RepID=A0A645BTG7_9ZZZZ
MNIQTIIYIIVGSIIVIGAIVIQVVFALSKKKYLGYILPALFLIGSIVYLFNNFDPTDYYGYGGIISNWIKHLLLYNIPSFALLILYELIHKNSQK